MAAKKRTGEKQFSQKEARLFQFGEVVKSPIGRLPSLDFYDEELRPRPLVWAERDHEY